MYRMKFIGRQCSASQEKDTQAEEKEFENNEEYRKATFMHNSFSYCFAEKNQQISDNDIIEEKVNSQLVIIDK